MYFYGNVVRSSDAKMCSKKKCYEICNFAKFKTSCQTVVYSYICSLSFFHFTTHILNNSSRDLNEHLMCTCVNLNCLIAAHQVRENKQQQNLFKQ